MSSKNSQLSTLIETALVAAFAMALSYIPDFASWFTPSFGAVPVVLFALRRGPKYGTLAGLIWGLLHFILGKVWYLALSQVIIEYIIAFISMGLAGFLSTPFQNALSKDNKGRALIYSTIGATLAVFVRYFWHYVAGFIFWGSYAPKGMSPYLYSLSVNGTAGLLTLVFVILALAIIIPTQGKLFLVKK
ncbi:energy-coupled thiamine transporter ThiT [Streptococcus infantarius]|uniref:energy-coupled thiamine transporter ThiT n=1 Tax=Streptococcus infantarius TaxID=102684 RepID=UPI0022E72E50|nr:energy-coupled thiamine transporter ThiT [Streptococcus infantarius]